MNHEELEEILKGCSLHAFLILTSRVLSRSGFGDVQLLDRRQSKGKSRFGGHEIQCETLIGTLPAKVVVKVIQDSVRVRMLDELAGTVRRTGSDLGIIVSPYELKAKAEETLESYAPLRLEALCGRTFSELLSRYHIGVRSRGGVDYAFFSSLEEMSSRLLEFMNESRL